MVAKAFVATHISQVYAPSYPLINYLKSRTERLITLLHPFLGEGIKEAQVNFYRSGEVTKRVLYYRWSSNQWVNYFADFLRTLFYSFTQVRKYNLYIGVNPLNTLPGIIARFFFRNKVVVYYSADYSKQRFKEPFFNDLYLALDKFCAQRADFCWSVSDRIRDVRSKQGVSEYQNLLVPNGVHVDQIKQRSLEEIIPNSLVYVGHLTKTKGIYEIVAGFEKAVKEMPELNLYFIGSGPEEQKLKREVRERNLNNIVHFLGRMSNKEVLEQLSQYAVGLAPYNLNDNYTYYCDPVKVKEYLAAGLPVVITDAVWVSRLIKNNNCGAVVDDLEEGLGTAVLDLLADSKEYHLYRKNAVELGSRFDWDQIYNSVFEKMKISNT